MDYQQYTTKVMASILRQREVNNFSYRLDIRIHEPKTEDEDYYITLSSCDCHSHIRVGLIGIYPLDEMLDMELDNSFRDLKEFIEDRQCQKQ